MKLTTKVLIPILILGLLSCNQTQSNIPQCKLNAPPVLRGIKLGDDLEVIKEKYSEFIEKDTNHYIVEIIPSMNEGKIVNYPELENVQVIQLYENSDTDKIIEIKVFYDSQTSKSFLKEELAAKVKKSMGLTGDWTTVNTSDNSMSCLYKESIYSITVGSEFWEDRKKISYSGYIGEFLDFVMLEDTKVKAEMKKEAEAENEKFKAEEEKKKEQFKP